MAFIKTPKSTKIKIGYLVGPINILIYNIPSTDAFIKFNSFIQLLRDLEFCFFPIPI